MISLQGINLCPGAPDTKVSLASWVSLVSNTSSLVFEWNPDLSMQDKSMAACAQMDENEIIQGQVILSVLMQ